jgi:acetylornithine deacetylase
VLHFRQSQQQAVSNATMYGRFILSALLCLHPGHCRAWEQQPLRGLPALQEPIDESIRNDGSSLSSPPWRESLLSLHKSLIDIRSTTGSEHGAGTFLLEYLTARGYTAQLQFVPPRNNTPPGASRFNVVAWPGASHQPSPRVLVTSHIDVVPPHIPYSISDEIPKDDTVISGRGSVDAKGSVAAQITAVQNLLDSGKIQQSDVMLAFVVGEEDMGDGMRLFSDSLKEIHPTQEFEAVIFGEPTENKLACGHKGGLFCDIRARGVAGHSGYPWLGKSANELMVKALSSIISQDLGSSESFGKTTVNIGRLEGGVAANVIPESSFADLAIRVAIGPEKTGGEIVKNRIRSILDGIDEEAFTFSCSHGYGVVECDCEVPGKSILAIKFNY